LDFSPAGYRQPVPKTHLQAEAVQKLKFQNNSGLEVIAGHQFCSYAARNAVLQSAGRKAAGAGAGQAVFCGRFPVEFM
jgi:hypothetical protein